MSGIIMHTCDVADGRGAVMRLHGNEDWRYMVIYVDGAGERYTVNRTASEADAFDLLNALSIHDPEALDMLNDAINRGPQ
jgi:hypothetical protein